MMNALNRALWRALLYVTTGPIGKLIRHGLGYAAGWLAAVPLLEGHGGIDPASLASWLTALVMLAVIAAWSAVVKQVPTGEQRRVARLVVEGLVGHLVPAIAGAMSARGYEGGVDDAGAMAEWGTIWLANLVRSALQRPDTPPAAMALPNEVDRNEFD